MASSRNVLELEIDEERGGIRSAIATLQCAVQSGRQPTDVGVQLVGYHLHREGDDTMWEILLDQLGSFPLLRLALSVKGYIISFPALGETIRRTRQSLESLTLENALFQGRTNELVTALREHPSLKTFSMLGCRGLHGEVIQAPLIHSLSSSPNLEVVSMRSVAPFMARDSLGPSVESLCHASKLEKLLLGELNLKGAWITNMFNCLKSNRSLKVLEAKNNFTPLGQDGVQALGDMLHVNSTLEDICISIGDSTTLAPIAEGMKSNRHLKNLELRTTRRLKMEESLPFANMLEENHVLQNLMINATRPFDNIIQFHLRLNRANRGRLLGGAPDTEWVDVIISNSDDVSVVFYLISRNPNLCKRATTAEATKTRKRPRLFLSPQTESLVQRALSSVGLQRPRKRQKR